MTDDKQYMPQPSNSNSVDVESMKITRITVYSLLVFSVFRGIAY